MIANVDKTALSKHFTEAYKREYIGVAATNNPDEMLITDNAILLKVSTELLKSVKPFTDRNLFPELPDAPGRGYRYGKKYSFARNAIDIAGMLQQSINNPEDLIPMAVTPWLFETNEARYRLLHNGTKYVFIRPVLLELFNSTPRLFQREHSRKLPIVITHDSANNTPIEANAVGILMPCLVPITDNRQLFPNIPELRHP